MARGKYKMKAQKRREEMEVTQEIKAYQHAVKRLTSERDEAKREFEKIESALRSEIRMLKAQLDSGFSLEIAAINSELEKARKKNEEMKRLSKKTEDEVYKMMDGFMRALMAHGWTKSDALDFLVSSSQGKSGLTIALDHKSGKVAKNARDLRLLEMKQYGRQLKRPVDDPAWRERFTSDEIGVEQ